MKQLKFPVFFTAFVVAIAVFLLGMFFGRSTVDNTVYVVPASTLPPEITESPQEPTLPAEAQDKKEKVNINTATAKELENLPGVGAVIAQRIVDYRLEYGDFITVEELKEVAGIGEKLFEEIKDHITVR